MKKIFFAAVFLLGAVYANAASAQENALISAGGQMYDKWYSIKGVKPPKGNHPSYVGKKKGASTWRCKECHGWDLKGATGAYSKGSHYTGIKGLQAYKNGSVKDIVAILKNDKHQYGPLMSDAELTAIATFVAKTQVDTDPYINLKTKKVTGDLMAGSAVFAGVCAKCHGLDGKTINFKEAPKEVYVGDAVRDNPWEALHKVRFGHPGTQMPALFGYSLKSAIDVLSYAQTLK